MIMLLFLHFKILLLVIIQVDFLNLEYLMQSDNNTATPIVTAVGVTLQLEAFTVSENDVVSGTGRSIVFKKNLLHIQKHLIY